MMENFSLSEDVYVIFNHIMKSDWFTHKLHLATQEMQELFHKNGQVFYLQMP